MIKLCTTHGKRAVLDFKSLVSEDDYTRLMDVVYLDSAEKLEEFSRFVQRLGVKKIQDWWNHKAMSPWILPCLIQSQSPMSAEDWDNTPSTTNTGEAQHHWTNVQLGTKQSLVEAMENVRKLDERVAREIAISLQSGILINSQNESYDRRARNTTRQSTTAQKSRESHDTADERAEVEHEIQALQAEKQDATAKLKELRTRKSALSKKSKRSQTRSVVVSASSSGRVKTRTIVSNSTPPRSITPAPTSPVASTSTLPLATPYYSSPPTMAPANYYFLLPAENEFLSNSYFPQTSYTPSSDFGVYAPLPAPSAFGDYGGSNFDFDFNLLEQFGYVPMDNIPPVLAPTFPQAVFAFDNASPAPLGALTMPGFDTTTLLPSDPATATSSPGASWPRLPPVPVSLALQQEEA
ncbi:hypothetical protein B0H16DRAFT_976984 [Mycena metata]|uniref:Uncharacterized protein n=1 Tax=Mycena metata TaxID=1033252 RepID=A0AAD7N4J9_9AGAR|nr:hypothetical protein B0H16DRAFT_976984 [Mycena metata]